jgi:UDP-N-acetylmuramoyl-L-alanyl-D-glutamate--2,6-diaminopimelate ligase
LVYGDSHRSFGFTTPESPVIASQLAWLANDGCRAMTMEVSSHGLALGRVSGLEFDLAVFTNLTRDHLDFHGDMERYLEAKLLLFRGLGMGEKGGNGVVNLDDPQAARFIQATSAKTLTYGIDAVEADVSVVDHRLYPWGSEVTVQSPLGVSSLDVRIPGRFNVANALAAFAAGIALGASENEIVRGIGSVDRVRGRMELLEGKGIRVVIDYAHTPEAIVKLLTTLGEIYPAGRIITVVGCGGERDVEKRPMMGEAAARLSQVLVLTSDNPRGEDPEAILDDLEQGVRRVREDYTRLTDREEAIRYAIGRAAVGDVVVIAGKGHEDYQIIGGKRYPFDDREVSRKVLAATGEDRESRGGGRV